MSDSSDVAYKFGGAAIRRFELFLGIGAIGSAASLPLLYLTFNLTALITTPITNVMIRQLEHNADRFALDLTHDNDSVKSLAVKYMHAALVVPDSGWFNRVFVANHPPLEDRVRFALSYHPWADGVASP